MNNSIFKNNKNGKYYTLLSDNFMSKEPNLVLDGENADIDYIWRKGLYLYRAEYHCPDGPCFARRKEDFESKFTRVRLRHIKKEMMVKDLTYVEAIKRYHIILDNGQTILCDNLEDFEEIPYESA